MERAVLQRVRLVEWWWWLHLLLASLLDLHGLDKQNLIRLVLHDRSEIGRLVIVFSCLFIL